MKIPSSPEYKEALDNLIERSKHIGRTKMQFDTNRSFFTNEAIIAGLGGNYQMLREEEEVEEEVDEGN